MRKVGNRVRIVVQLVGASTSAHLWSQSFDRELGDILALQTEIASAVADALQVSLGLGPIALSTAGYVNPEAFDSYLRGLQQLWVYSDASLARAEQFFTQSIQQDPDFVRAYYGLGLTYFTQVNSAMIAMEDNRGKLRKIITRGLSLEPDNAGLLALSGQLARYDGNLELAESLLQRAIALDPSDSWVRELYAVLKLDQSYPDQALEIHLRSLDIDPLNPVLYQTLCFIHIDLGNSDEALASAAHLSHIAPSDNLNSLRITGTIKTVMLGDLSGGIHAWEIVSESDAWGEEGINMKAVSYYSMGDMEKGDVSLERTLDNAPDTTFTRAVQAYRLALNGEMSAARTVAVDAISNPQQFTRWWGGIIAMRLAVDALIDQGEAERAVDLMLKIAPEWAYYKDHPEIDPGNFSPAPYKVKSSYSSYPALYFKDFIRALRAANDPIGAENMLTHLEKILQWRRERGLFIEETHVAEALALRGQWDAALDSLEQAEEAGTIYNYWQVRLLYSAIFDHIRNHPRYEALVDRVKMEMDRQRATLRARRSSSS